MGDGTQPPSLILGILFIFSAYLALAETALSCVSKNKVKAASEKNDQKASRTLKILDNFDEAVTTLLIFVNITHIAIASIITVWVTRVWGLGAVSLSTVITTIVVFFLCEMLPKSIAKKKSYALSLWCSGLLSFLMKIARPFAKMLTATAGFLTAKSKTDKELSATEDEIQDIIEDMAEEGAIEETQGDLITSALQFGDETAEGILTPRDKICAINDEKDSKEVFDFVRTQLHSRIPVYHGTIDNIVGVLHVRKYMKQYIKTSKIPNLKRLTDSVYYANKNTEIHELLHAMSKNKMNIAVIKDDNDTTLGIVTVEDILEELVGEIWDEDDVVKEVR